MRTFLLVLLVAAWAPSASAEDSLREQVVDRLSAYEDPASGAEWRALGAGAELYALAQDTSLSPAQRAGAVYALGFFPTAANRAFLAALVGADGADALLRRKAVYALGAGWGEGAILELSGALAAPDTQLRVAAARALGKVGTAAAQSALRARVAVEPNPAVRTTLSTALGGG